jgi:Secretion system C-terminal sorting domain
LALNNKTLNKKIKTMKNFYFLTATLLSFVFGNAQLTAVTYKGAFAPAPAAMWTDSWTNFDPQTTVYPDPATATAVVGNITTNTTWTTGTTYYLKGQTYVTSGATLTIEPGVVILADHTAVGAGLFITKGSKINAVGTAASPIVFTSDNAPGSRNKGDWGGIILLGKSNYNINGGVNNIEGIAASADTQYGGGATPDLADNSGTLKYVRIEFGGYVYAANQEINGLTFGAVGSGTTIDYVQVSFANDDSFEWFGGSVNCSHLVAYRGLDDDWDTDNGFSGNVQFCLGIRDPQISDNPTISTSNGFESDNNATSVDGTSFTTCTFSNVTEIGPHYRLTLPNGGTIATGFGRMAQLRRNSRQTIINSVLMDYNNGIHIDGYVTVAGATSNTETNASNDLLKYKYNILAGSTKAAYVNTPTVAVPNTNVPLLNIATWYTAGTNTSVPTNTTTPILTKPYDLTDARIYTGLDYRPVIGGGADTGANFGGTLDTTSFNVANESSLFYVYPNSFANTFKLNYGTTSTEKIVVNVYDLLGKQIETHTVAPSDFNNLELGNSYNTGTYFVNIKQGQTEKTVRAIKE